ncbi:hepatic lectin-like [Anguilla anguilla]|uniref:hepatic lectin-like n=1 Tax=Anguilla anguilla TaxID=7936 RepID=UPI0015AFCF1F|nr:hepatic lectin-like [Anguilla anguilla]
MNASRVSHLSEGTYTGLVSSDHAVYSTVDQTSLNHPRAQQTALVTIDKRGRSSHPYRLAAACLGLLCALFLAATLVLCVLYGSVLGELKACNSTLNQDMDQPQRDYSGVFMKLPFLDGFCPLIAQKRECIPCPQGWEQFSFKCYYFSTERKSWMSSRSDCIKRGADLVVIESEEEQEFITNHTKEDHCWIGLSDLETEGIWIWVDGTPLQRGFWVSGEPDDHYWINMKKYEKSDCALTMTGKKAWADNRCDYIQYWICETNALLP